MPSISFASLRHPKLFWRIFILSSLAMSLVGVGFSLFVASRYPSEQMKKRSDRFMNALSREGEGLMDVYAEKGEEALMETLDDLAKDLGMTLMLSRKDGATWEGEDRFLHRDFADQNAKLLEFAQSADKTGQVRRFADIEATAVRLEHSAFQEPYYLLALRSRVSPFSRALRREKERSLLIMVVAMAFSFVLARYFTRPIEHLSQASREIAEGNLSVRIGPSLRSKTREIMQLAEDFDHMAERIQALLQQQTQLLRDISHELRSPLARMTVALELVQKKTGDMAPKLLHQMERDISRLEALISEILEFTRLESLFTASSHDELRACDLSKLAQGMLENAAFEAQKKNQRITFDGPKELPYLGHPEWIERAIENVLRNAMQHAPEGSEIGLGLKKSDKEDAWLLSITDEGPGVSEEELEAIFVPFFRSDKARGHKNGSGVGLAIVSKCMALHGGKVSAELRKEGGLVVKMTWPFQPKAPEKKWAKS